VEVARRGVSGKAVTPFLLAHIVETTGGRSLSSNNGPEQCCFGSPDRRGARARRA
jgi:hypothetical protein